LSPTQINFLKSTHNYYNNMSVISVAKALESVTISQQLVNYIRENRDVWTTFGKKNSHLLRAQLFRMYETENMKPEEIFMIHFFFSVIKNRDRVKQALDNMSQADKSKAWYRKVYQFIDKKLVQYVSQEKNGKFAVVHLPTTMPGLDILCTVLTMKGTDEEFEELIGKQTFAQLNLSADLQAENKEKQKQFWENMVNSSRNPDQNAYKSGFVEEFYKNSASDTYNLINLNSSEYAPPDKDEGYSKGEVRKWFDKVLSNKMMKDAD